MKITNKLKATSIVESMVIMLIVVSGVTGMYNIYSKSLQLSNGIANKIQAIQIAKQGIEAMINIRDTNWILFSSDYLNCWNVYSYNSLCIGDNGGINDPDGNETTYDIESGGKYKIFLDGNNRWTLEKKSTSFFGNSTYNNDFKIGLDNGIYTQTGITEDTKVFFTREIRITYLQKNGTSAGDETDPKMKIVSKVQWVDNTSDKVRKVELEQVLSNWRE